MNIIVECFGASRRWCGGERIDLELPGGATVGDALDLLGQRIPEFAARRKGIAAAIGDVVVYGDRVLQAGDCLALIPPVSGG